MKTLGKVLGVIVVCLVLLLPVLRITGFEPHGPTPGLWLKGDLVTTPVADWSFTDKYPNIEVQTNTWYLLPHSVTTFCIAYNGQLYLASYYYRPGIEYPHGRTWNEYVARDPHVRLKIGKQLYDRTLSYVTDPAEKAGFLQALAKKYPQPKMPESSRVIVFHVLDN
ncbi:MAG TPA: hypothetical protein VEV17_23550 [Bryobacteraceae bacterium]|nr:hypothetical protein [Bryobacteraceae bacterium]